MLADLWLHAVIDNDPKVRELREQRQEIAQMLRKPKGIQRQVQITNRLETPFYIVAQHPVVGQGEHPAVVAMSDQFSNLVSSG